MKKFFKRFSFAFQGLSFLILKDKNIRFHLYLLAILIAFAFFFKISSLEWIAVLTCSSLVICFEALNTIIERISDKIESNIHPEIKIIKDAAAGVVLIASIFSLVIAGIIFIPKIYNFFFA